jgi:antitoxin (DNA-binding transcriptional repressor) of toxin-antitoxin stability system
MIQTLSVNEVSIKTVIKFAKSGDEIVLEENGQPFAKIIPFDKHLDDELWAWETASDEDFVKFETRHLEKI